MQGAVPAVSLEWPKNQKEQSERVEHAGLTGREVREAAHDVGIPEGEFPLAKGLVEDNLQRVVLEDHVADEQVVRDRPGRVDPREHPPEVVERQENLAAKQRRPIEEDRRGGENYERQKPASGLSRSFHSACSRMNAEA